MDGYIEGGWPFVIAAYSITWTGLVGYIVSLWVRSK
jgi:CcmD family protein